MSGWFAVKRGITSHPIFKKRPDRAFVWLWMLETAAYKNTRQDAGGKPVNVKRGQVLTSFRQIEAATGVGLQVIRTLFKLLESEHAINTDTSNGRLLVTICNYEKYQASEKGDNTSPNTEPTQRQHTKETREQINNTPLTPQGGMDGFQAFWDAYPHRNGQKKNRKGAEAKFAKAVKSGASADQIMAGVKAMMADPDVQRGFARDAATWLNQEGWKDERKEGARPALTVIPRAPNISREFEMVLRGYGM